MPVATRVRLAPPAPWSEHLLLAAARAFAPDAREVRAGDAVGELVVVEVHPGPAATLAPTTEVEILPTPPRADAPLVDVIVLLDVSESMALPWDADHTRLQAARAALQGFLAAPGAAVAGVTLMEYAKEARVVAGPAAPKELKLPEAPTPKGRSATASAIDAALAHVAARAPERTHVIFLLTDGVGEVDALQAAAERAGRLRIPIHSLVFAPAVDELFDGIAEASRGSSQLAAHPLTIEFEHEV